MGTPCAKRCAGAIFLPTATRGAPSYEPTLLGRRGVQYRLVNVRGLDKGPFRGGGFDTLAMARQDLHLSIAANLQAYGEELLAGWRGSIVALDLRTGEILCFVSAPHYQPQVLSGKGRGNRYLNLLRNPDRPLMRWSSYAGQSWDMVWRWISKWLGAW